MPRPCIGGAPSGGGQVPAPFTPLSLSPYHWWHAASGVVLSATGGVQSWTDIVGGLAVTQATAANQPRAQVNGFGGRPMIYFDGTDDFLNVESVGNLPVGANPCEIWVVVDQQGTDAAFRRIFSYGGNANFTSRSVFRRDTNAASAIVGDGVGSTALIDPATNFSGRHFVRARIEAAQSAIARDTATLGAFSAVVPSTGTTRTRIGASTANTANLFGQGGVAHVLVLPLLSQANADALAAWGRTETGL